LEINFICTGKGINVGVGKKIPVIQGQYGLVRQRGFKKYSSCYLNSTLRGCQILEKIVCILECEP
jgi:hypothetical protein